MRYQALSFILLLGSLFVLNACVSTPTRNTSPDTFNILEEVWPHDASDVPRAPDITYGQLDNGMRYVLQKNTRPEGQASLRFWIRAGRRNEADNTLGIAHFLEHMAFNGSENVPEGEMVTSLERLGLAFGADTNASVNFTRTVYKLELPQTDDETIDYALFLMRETADRLLITPEAVERERGVITAEEIRKNNPRFNATRTRLSTLYPDALSTHRNGRKTPEQIASITHTQLRDFYEAHYRPERAILVIVGDIDVLEMEKDIHTVFSDWTNDTEAPADPDNGHISNLGPDAHIYNDDTLTSSILMYGVTPSTKARDSQKLRRKQLVRSIGTAIVNRRINKKIKDGDISFTASNLRASSSDLGDNLSIRLTPKSSDDWAEVMDEIVGEINTALEFGFQPRELQDHIARHNRRLENTVKNEENLSSKRLGESILIALERGQVKTTPQFRLDLFSTHMANISPDEVHAAFKETWGDFAPFIWLQGPGFEAVTKEEVLHAYKKAKAAPAQPPIIREPLTFAYTDFGAPGKIVSRSRVDDMGIDQLVFENNVRLNLKKTDFDNEQFQIRVTFGNGLSVFPKTKPGLPRLARLLGIGGFEAHAYSEVPEIFLERTPDTELKIGTERLRFEADLTRADSLQQLQVWTGLLTAPGYRNEWLERYKRSITRSFHTIDSTPRAVASRDLARIWRNGDPRFGLASKEAYLSYTLEDVRDILDPSFQTGPIEIGVVGDFDEDQIIGAIAETFGALPTRETTHTALPDAYDITFPAAGRVDLTHTGAGDQGAFYMAWPLPQQWSGERMQKYTMIRRILHARMRAHVREELGLTYSPRASLTFSEIYKGYGYLSASMTSDPQYYDAFEAAMTKIVSDLRAGGITQDELDRARRPLFKYFETRKKQNSGWIMLVTYSQTKPERLDVRRARQAAYESMTPAILDTIAAELFDPERLHIIAISPEP